MTLAQIFDFKELTGKILKLNDLLPHGRCKLFIPRSLRALPGYQVRPISASIRPLWG